MAGPSVLLVGAGLTSSLTASLLAQAAPSLSLTVWEKARGAGGRMATSRAPSCPSCTVDLGAQYLSPSSQEVEGQEYRALLEAGVIMPVNLDSIEGHRHARDSLNFMAPGGASSIVKHFMSKSGAKLEFGRQMTALEEREGRWRAVSACGQEQQFDAVVITMPVPQLLQLQGDVAPKLEEQGLLAGLQQVRYSTRFVLGLFHNEHVDLGVAWAAKYIPDHPVLRFAAVDSAKRGKAEGPTSVLVHSTVGWGAKHAKLSPKEAEPLLMKEVGEMFPSWPQPKETKPLKWLYSQVLPPAPFSPAPCPSGAARLSGVSWPRLGVLQPSPAPGRRRLHSQQFLWLSPVSTEPGGRAARDAGGVVRSRHHNNTNCPPKYLVSCLGLGAS